MAPPSARPAPAWGPEVERQRSLCGPIWIRCPSYPARGRRALNATVPEQAVLDAGSRARGGRQVPASGGCAALGSEDACVGKGHPATSIGSWSRCGWSNLLLSGTQKGRKLAQITQSSMGFGFPNTPLTQAPTSKITSSHPNAIRSHQTAQQDEFLEMDQASPFI